MVILCQVVSVITQAIRGLELVIVDVDPGMAGGAAGACIVVVHLQGKQDKGKPVSHVRFLFSALRRLRTRRIAARQVFSRSKGPDSTLALPAGKSQSKSE
jgi:hypothetical protein